MSTPGPNAVKSETANVAQEIFRSAGKCPTSYEQVLIDAQIAYQVVDLFLIVGDASIRDMEFYLSVTSVQIVELLKKILPHLERSACAFCMPKDEQVLHMILNGSLGQNMIGKVVTIYPNGPDTALTIARELMRLSAGFHGPEVPSAILLSSSVYAPSQQMPQGPSAAKWPYSELAMATRAKKSKWLDRKYVKLQNLKNDPKGNVYKGLNVSNWLNIRWCVIKEGKKYQCTDTSGRDIRDRLKWQHRLQTELYGLVAVPAPFDLFTDDNDNAYFIMEFIEGRSLLYQTALIQQGTFWQDAALKDKLYLLDLAIQLTKLVESFHLHGYLHRDLSPMNFIVTPEDRVVAIDLELCYSYQWAEPEPAFMVGTPGFRSPDQTAGKVPCIQDDFFGLGGLLIQLITGVSPVKFEGLSAKCLIARLYYFTGDQPISEMIAACRSADPDTRPGLDVIGEQLARFRTIQRNERRIVSRSTLNVDHRYMIIKAIKSLGYYPYLGKWDLWYAPDRTIGYQVGRRRAIFECYNDLRSGTAGILYTLNTAEHAGFDLASLSQVKESNLAHLLVEVTAQGTNTSSDPGLFSGSAGLAVLMARSIDYGGMENSMANRLMIWSLLSRPTDKLTLADGGAGQGIAIIQCSKLLAETDWVSKLKALASIVVTAQHRDGAWYEKDVSGALKARSGLFHGTAGIAYFLMMAGQVTREDIYKTHACLAIEWLRKQKSIFQAGDPWLEHGRAGLAYLFLKGYEYYGTLSYRECAEQLLSQNPQRIASNYTEWGNGIAGLGQVYLEAYRLLKDTEWLDRAEHIREFLLHVGQPITQQESLGWLNGDEDRPVPGFFDGHAGTFYFLLSMDQPENINFPFIHYEL